MTETATITALTAEELNRVAVERVIEGATMLARDAEWDKWRAYEIAKIAIGGFTSTAEEYEAAIKQLTEALGV